MNLCSIFFFFFKQKTAYEIRLSLVGSEMCIRDSNLTVDMPGFETAMQQQRERARSSSSFSSELSELPKITDVTTFVGYQSLEVNSEVVGLYKEGQVVATASEGESVLVV